MAARARSKTESFFLGAAGLRIWGPATGGPPPVLFIGAALAVVAAVYFVKFA